MTDFRGRDLRIWVGLGDDPDPDVETHVIVARGSADSLDLSNSTEEIDTKDEQGWQSLFPEGAKKAMTMSGQAVASDDASFERLRAVAESLTDPSANFQFRIALADMYRGRFQITQFSLAGEVNGAARFNFSVASVGVVTRAPLP